jgi:hypothetical protein
MNNTGQIIRSKKDGTKGYTPISNEILQSKVLKPNQKSVLVHLLSLPQDWIVYKLNIWREMNLGREAFNAAWKGLVELGYIVSNKIIDPDTHLILGYNHIVFEEPPRVSLCSGLSDITEIRLSGKLVDIQTKERQKIYEQNKEEEIRGKSIIGPEENSKSESSEIIPVEENQIEQVERALSLEEETFLLFKNALDDLFREEQPSWEKSLAYLGVDQFIRLNRSQLGNDPDVDNLVKEFYELKLHYKGQ